MTSEIGVVRRLLIRPELGAVAGAVLIWVFFAAVAGEPFRSVAGTASYLNAAAPLGILAVAVSLLMIGGSSISRWARSSGPPACRSCC